MIGGRSPSGRGSKRKKGLIFLRELLTVDLQHGRGLRLAHAVLRRAGVRALVLLPHAEQAEAVAVADLEPGGDNRGEIRGRWWRSGRNGR